MITRFSAPLCLALLLAACNTPCPPAPAAVPPAHFVCEDGSRLTVTFARQPDVAHVAQDGYATLTLPIAVSGSGYRYAGAGAELRGRGQEATWTRPGAAETLCREQR